MLQKIRKQNEGFTIIEVLIVLAIAGLILLIVFIAVPALQRNSRNTQRRNDVASVLGGISEWSNNNNGSFPSSFTNANGKKIYINLLTSTQQEIPTSYYDSGASGTISLSGVTGDVTNGTNPDSILIVRGAICDGGNAEATGASGRSYVALFTVEPNVKQCQAS